MNKSLLGLLISALFFACTSSKNLSSPEKQGLTIAFGSCNNQKKENYLWKEILKHQPAAWVWGGDNVYSDTDNMDTLWRDYQIVLQHPDYKKLRQTTQILGTWDDHDYGMNDGGVHFSAKKASQNAFWDFMGISKTDKRRLQEGVYHADIIKTKEGTINIISLDTRYFRTDLTKSSNPEKRYQPNKYGEGSMLGEAQWAWLAKELTTSKADFNVIMSSVQVLSGEHGFESWGNMPHEVDRLAKLIQTSQAKGVIILSGDRHISEFSKMTIDGLSYPLIDFTSSGLTHVYESFTSEANKYRVGAVVPKISFGLLLFDFKTKEVTMQIRGKDDVLLGELKQRY